MSVKSAAESRGLRALMALPEAVLRRLAGAPVVLDGQTLAPDLQLMLRLQRLLRKRGMEVAELERVGYDFGFELGLADVASGASSPGASVTDAMESIARLLSRYGFAARSEGAHSVRACACPFEELAFDDPERICGLDRAIWRGMLAAFAPDATLRVATTRARGDDACVATVDAGLP